MNDHEYEIKVSEMRALLGRGEHIYTILRHVSRSGTMRALDVYLIRNNQPLRLTRRVADLLDLTYSQKYDALIKNGCGMDVGYEVVYNLAYTLFKDGYALEHHWL